MDDVDRAAAFCTRVFGSVETWRGPGTAQLQTPGSWDALVLEERPHAPPGDGFHSGFRLIDPADVDAAARRVAEAGGEVLERGEFVPGEPCLFAGDPDGYTGEIWFEPPTPVDPRPEPAQDVHVGTT